MKGHSIRQGTKAHFSPDICPKTSEISARAGGVPNKVRCFFMGGDSI